MCNCLNVQNVSIEFQEKFSLKHDGRHRLRRDLRIRRAELNARSVDTDVAEIN